MPKPKRPATERMNFTLGRIESLAKPESRRTIYDRRVPNLGLRIEPSGRKIFFWWRAVLGTPTWRLVGKWPEVTLDAARTKAKEFDILLENWKSSGCPPPNPFDKPVVAAAAPTFEQLVESYIENHLRHKALNPTTAVYAVRKRVEKHFTSWLKRPIDEIAATDVLRVKNACGKKVFAAEAVVSFARTLFTWSAKKRDGKINFWPVGNPAKDVSLPDLKNRRVRKRYLQPEELVRFRKGLEKTAHKVLRDVLVLLLATGARKGNVYAMRWQDVSFELKRWHVPTSKSGEDYMVNLTPAALEILERRRGEVAKEERFVFPSYGDSGHTEDIKKRWTEFRKGCGFPDVRLHDVRRTKGSYMAIDGISLQLIGAALGHKSLGSTAVYAQLHGSAVAKALEAGDATMERMMAEAKKRIESKNLPQLST